MNEIILTICLIQGLLFSVKPCFLSLPERGVFFITGFFIQLIVCAFGAYIGGAYV